MTKNVSDKFTKNIKHKESSIINVIKNIGY